MALNERIALVTDSACDASDAELAELGIECVHLKVTMPDGSMFPEDNTDANKGVFYDFIADCDELPHTSMPSPADFGELYSRLALEGYTHVISMHIASAQSGTYNAARLASQSSPLEIAVIDTCCNTIGQFLFVRRIAQLRDKGYTFAQLVDTAHKLVGKTSVVFMLDTLRCLVKGGRTGRAVGLAASLLNIKPMLTVEADGEVNMWGKVRSPKKAIPKLVDKARELTEAFGPIEACLVHVRDLADVTALKHALEESGLPVTITGLMQTGPVITTHVCVGCFGFAYIPMEA